VTALRGIHLIFTLLIRENGCITQELILITFQFSNFHIHFLSHKKIIPLNKLVHFILTDWLDQDDMLTAKGAD
jgi:hypothetical protein